MVGVMVQSMGSAMGPAASHEHGAGRDLADSPISRKAGGEAGDCRSRDARTADLDALRARLAAEVRLTYARLYAADQEQASLSAAKEFVEVLVATAAARYGAGQGDIEALAKIELERSGLDERGADVGAERSSLAAALNRLTGRGETDVIATVETLPDPILPPGALLDAALTHSPELRVERASIEVSSRRLRAAETERTPNFVVGLAAGAGISGDPIITLRFGAEVPLWRGEKQEPMVRAAEHDVQAAREDLRDGERRVRAELQRLVANWRRDCDQIERYRGAILPQSSVAFDAARSAYATGRGDFTTVADDFRRWLDARLGLARREADRFTTWAEVQAIIARRRIVGTPETSHDHLVARSVALAWVTVWCWWRYRGLLACEHLDGRYHCPMHPTYVSDTPGDCPICGMRLTPFANVDKSALANPRPPIPPKPVRSNGSGSAPVRHAPIEVSAEGMRLAGVQTAVAEQGHIERTIRAAGVVRADERRIRHVHTKVAGWIEKLYADFTGEAVLRGRPILTIYSQELLASQQEYLRAREASQKLQGSTVAGARQGADDMLAAARERLELFDVPAQFIAALDQRGSAAANGHAARPFVRNRDRQADRRRTADRAWNGAL